MEKKAVFLIILAVIMFGLSLYLMNYSEENKIVPGSIKNKWEECSNVIPQFELECKKYNNIKVWENQEQYFERNLVPDSYYSTIAFILIFPGLIGFLFGLVIYENSR